MDSKELIAKLKGGVSKELIAKLKGGVIEVSCVPITAIAADHITAQDARIAALDDEATQHVRTIGHLNRRIAELEAQLRWIPVSERLPERTIELPALKMPNGEVLGPQKNSRRVLVRTEGNATPEIDYVIEGADSTCVWYLAGESAIVTHWRELGELPKE